MDGSPGGARDELQISTLAFSVTEGQSTRTQTKNECPLMDFNVVCLFGENWCWDFRDVESIKWFGKVCGINRCWMEALQHLACLQVPSNLPPWCRCATHDSQELGTATYPTMHFTSASNKRGSCCKYLLQSVYVQADKCVLGN